MHKKIHLSILIALTSLSVFLISTQAQSQVTPAPSSQSSTTCDGFLINKLKPQLAALKLSSTNWALFCADNSSSVNQGLNVVYGKNYNSKTGIASITKLMTALIANRLYSSTTDFTVASTSLTVASYGRFKVGTTYSFGALMHSMLIESDNDAAEILADRTGAPFISMMNQEAKTLGLTSTSYKNVHGLDLLNGQASNISTPSNIAELMYYMYKTTPLISFTDNPYFPIDSTVGLDHVASSTNPLLTTKPYSDYIVGSKTGNTDAAKTNLALLWKYNGVTYVSVVLHSSNQFADTEKIMDTVFGITK